MMLTASSLPVRYKHPHHCLLSRSLLPLFPKTQPGPLPHLIPQPPLPAAAPLPRPPPPQPWASLLPGISRVSPGTPSRLRPGGGGQPQRWEENEGWGAGFSQRKNSHAERESSISPRRHPDASWSQGSRTLSLRGDGQAASAVTAAPTSGRETAGLERRRRRASPVTARLLTHRLLPPVTRQVPAPRLTWESRAPSKAPCPGPPSLLPPSPLPSASPCRDPQPSAPSLVRLPHHHCG